MRVLDVGCYDFRHSIELRDAGCIVTAIDKQKHETPIPDGVTFIQNTFEQFPVSETDILFLSYVAPFIPRDEFLKLLNAYAPLVKIIAVRAFTKKPEPSFNKEISLYAESDFAALPLKPIDLRSWTDEHKDLGGEKRVWHTIQYIGVKE